MAIQLGSKVRDSITGFAGIAAGRADFMYGCARIQVQSQELKDGKPIEPEWFDEQRIEVVVEQSPKVSASSSASSGGPQSDCVRSSRQP